MPLPVKRLLTTDTRAAKALALEILQAAEEIEGPRGLDVKADGVRRIRPHIAHLPHEQFCGAIYDSSERFLGMFHGGPGSTSGCTLFPRVLVHRILDLQGTMLVLGHNHPAQTLIASQYDRATHSRLESILAPLEVKIKSCIITASSHAFYGE